MADNRLGRSTRSVVDEVASHSRSVTTQPQTRPARLTTALRHKRLPSGEAMQKILSRSILRGRINANTPKKITAAARGKAGRSLGMMRRGGASAGSGERTLTSPKHTPSDDSDSVVFVRQRDRAGRGSRIPEGINNESSASTSQFGVRSSKPARVPTGSTAGTSTGSVATRLNSMIGRVAATSGEKYMLLEERDKLIRSALGQGKLGLHAGTCSDMCSEKERYQREMQHQVTSFEGDAERQVIDHFRAVKDYARSAADAAEPLSHELRPLSSLKYTMQYLLKNVAGNDPPALSQCAMWFDFLWSRTRAIRKDLTQQKFCSQEAVALFEMCVRLHVFAAHWLCELPAHEFDQKMNTENLSKSLQSLRHLYDDLNKRGVLCANEPEFRAFEILLNLADPNVASNALSWSETVLRDQRVQAALAAMTAFHSRHYTRFFRVVKSQLNYLQAALVHRYFYQVRVEALAVVVNAYQKQSWVPIADLSRSLYFDDDADCTEFLQVLGLRVVGADVQIVKSEFTQSKEMKRSMALETKRGSTPLCDVIYNAPLPALHPYTPIVSFDERNRYVHDPVILPFIYVNNDEDTAASGLGEATRTTAGLFSGIGSLRESEENRGGKLTESFSNIFSAASSSSKGLFAQPPPSEATSLFGSSSSVLPKSSPVAAPLFAKSPGKESEQGAMRSALEGLGNRAREAIVDNVVSEEVKDMAFYVVENVVGPSRECSNVLEQLVEEVVEERVGAVGRSCLMEEKSEQVEVDAITIVEEHVPRMVAELVREECLAFFNAEVKSTREAAELLRRRHDERLYLRVLRRWRNWAHSRAERLQRKRRLLDNFPATSPGWSTPKCKLHKAQSRCSIDFDDYAVSDTSPPHPHSTNLSHLRDQFNRHLCAAVQTHGAAHTYNNYPFVTHTLSVALVSSDGGDRLTRFVRQMFGVRSDDVGQLRLELAYNEALVVFVRSLELSQLASLQRCDLVLVTCEQLLELTQQTVRRLSVGRCVALLAERQLSDVIEEQLMCSTSIQNVLRVPHNYEDDFEALGETLGRLMENVVESLVDFGEEREQEDLESTQRVKEQEVQENGSVTIFGVNSFLSEILTLIWMSGECAGDSATVDLHVVYSLLCSVGEIVQSAILNHIHIMDAPVVSYFTEQGVTFTDASGFRYQLNKLLKACEYLDASCPVDVCLRSLLDVQRATGNALLNVPSQISISFPSDLLLLLNPENPQSPFVRTAEHNTVVDSLTRCKPDKGNNEIQTDGSLQQPIRKLQEPRQQPIRELPQSVRKRRTSISELQLSEEVHHFVDIVKSERKRCDELSAFYDMLLDGGVVDEEV